MKVVQFFSGKSVYITGMLQELEVCPAFNASFENYSIDLLEVMKDFENKCNISDYSQLNKLAKLIYWIRMNRYLLLRYGHLEGGVVDIQYVSIFYVMLLPFLTRTFDRIVLSFWGSDLLRQNRLILCLLKTLVRRAEFITFPTSDMADSFRRKMGCGFNDKIHVVRFGNYYLDRIDCAKDSTVDGFVHKYGIDTSRKVIVVGYNRFKEQQHIKVLESIVEGNIERDRIFIVIPWTYGPDNKDYKKQIESIISGRYEYVFLNERLSDEELVALRKVTDVLVSVLLTDALNATMLETMYSGGEIITGSWLKYDYLYSNGIVMRQVDNASDVGDELAVFLDSPYPEEINQKNRDIVGILYRWESIIEEWVKLYI